MILTCNKMCYIYQCTGAPKAITITFSFLHVFKTHGEAENKASSLWLAQLDGGRQDGLASNLAFTYFTVNEMDSPTRLQGGEALPLDLLPLGSRDRKHNVDALWEGRPEKAKMTWE